jgi:hypothetical protein
MHLVNVVLFLHIFIAILAFGCATLLHTTQVVMRGATSTATLKAWSPVSHRVEPFFPVLALVLFGLGGWLVGLSDGEFSWGDGWVVTSIVGLALMELVGGAVLAPRGKGLHEAIMSAPDGAVDAGLRQKVLDPAVWGAAAFETATALGIVYLMTNKPSGVASALIVAACAIVGALIGAAAARAGVSSQPRPAAAAAPSS